MEKIVFSPDEGEAVEFYVLEQTRLGGINYILVADSEEEDAEALILKDISALEETESLYETVADEAELEAVATIFSNMLDDLELEL